MRRHVSGLVVALLLTVISLGSVAVTITVPGDYPSIQAAIDAAQAGDTVFIAEGNYSEGLVIRKALSLVGEDRGLVRIGPSPGHQSENLGPVIEILSVEGLVKFACLTIAESHRGIAATTIVSTRVEIVDCSIIDCDEGIVAEGKGLISLVNSCISTYSGWSLFFTGISGSIRSCEIYSGSLAVGLFGCGVIAMHDNLVVSPYYVLVSDWDYGPGEDRLADTTILQGRGNRLGGRDEVRCGISDTANVLSIWVGFGYPVGSFPAGFRDAAWDRWMEDATSKLREAFDAAYNDEPLSYTQALIAEGMDLLSNCSYLRAEACWHKLFGIHLASHGHYQEALEEYRTAQRIIISSYGRRSVWLDERVGKLLYVMGRLEEGRVVFREVWQYYQDHDLQFDSAQIGLFLGRVLLELGRIEEALDLFVEARDEFLGCGGIILAEAIDAIAQIGEVYASLGRFEDAFACFGHAFALLDVCTSTGHYACRSADASSLLIDLASAMCLTEQHEAALLWLKTIQDASEQQAAYVTSALAIRVTGDVLRSQGKSVEALAQYVLALESLRKIGTESQIAECLHGMAAVLLALNRPSEALAACVEAISGLDGDVPPNAETMSYPMIRWRMLLLSGRSLEARGLHESAVDSYTDSMTIIESLRLSFTSENLKLAWQDRTQEVYERLVDLLHRMGQGDLALSYAERCRARTFLDLLAMGPLGTLENLAEEGIRTGVVEVSVIESDLASVVAGLPANTAALEYFVTDDVTYVWVITQNGVSDPIPIKIARQELVDTVVAFRQEIESSTGGMSVAAPLSLLDKARDLYDLLIEPVKRKFTGIEHLIVIPSGPLYYLPFNALYHCPGCEGRELYGGEYLIKQYAISYSPSLATLKYAQALSNTAYPDASFLGLADPDSGDPTIPRLPDAQREARVVAELFPVHSVYVDRRATEDVVQRQSSTAREILLSTHGLFNPHNPMYSYLLVSPTASNKDGKLFAHEVFSLPLRADMVVLSACETLLPSIEDMTDQVNKIARQAGDEEPKKLTEDQLKTLTAGDEIVGLTRAFLYAGTPSVLSSLWSVYSQATADLMVTFYEGLQTGRNKAEALRDAQLQIMQTSGYEHPAYWAAFNLMGDWR